MKAKADLMNPFPGLRSFRSDEDYLFFGRDEQTLELMARLERNRFIAVVGTSGRGKSSLVRCGLLSRLQGGGMVGAGAHWEIAVMHPGGNPLHHLAEALFESGLHDRAREDALPHLLATLGRSQFGLIEAVRQAALPAGTNFLLVVDQFEEIFRYDEAGATESEVANDFIAMLREASAQSEVPIYIVTTMRSDFIGDCSRFEGLAEAVNRGEYLIPGLNRDQFKAAIEGPIRVAGGQIAPRLLQRLLNDLGEEQDQLPCLQHALMRTWRVWQGRADAPALDLEDYAQVGKMSQALSLHADEVFSGLATDRQRELGAAMFKALTVEGSEKRGIRRPRRLLTLCGTLGVAPAELTPIIDAFRHPEVSFLMPPSDVPLRDTTVIDLSHESLMRVWTRLRDWVDDEAKSVGIFRRLSESAALWRERKSGFYRDPELSIARAWVESSRPNAVWAVQYDGNFEQAMAFLQASSDAAQEEVRAHEAARQRELEQARALAETERQRAEEQTRFAGRLKWLVRGLGVVVMAALTAMLFAIAARREAQINAQLARQNSEAARASEKKAEQVQAMADTARLEAEKLVAFLLEDFYDELAPTGRLDTVVKLADQVIAYYDRLPAELRSNETARNRALAKLRQAVAFQRLRDFRRLGSTFNALVLEFERLWASGDRSEVTAIGLAIALVHQVSPADREFAEFRQANLRRAGELLRDLTLAPSGSNRVKLEYCQNQFLRGSSSTTPRDEARTLLEDARERLRGLGAADFSNLDAAGLYAAVTLAAVGIHDAEKKAIYQKEAMDVAEQVIARRPGDLRALSIRLQSRAALADSSDLPPETALTSWQGALQAAEELIRFDPTDARNLSWMGLTLGRTGEALMNVGRLDEAAEKFRAMAEVGRKISFGPRRLLHTALERTIEVERKRGNTAAAEEAEKNLQLVANQFSGMQVSAGGSALVNDASQALIQAGNGRATWMAEGKYEEVIAAAQEMLARVDDLFSQPEILPPDRPFLESVRERAWRHIGEANIMLGRYAEAEAAFRGRAASQAKEEAKGPVTGDMALRSVWHALAVARLGRGPEALAIVEPARQLRRGQFGLTPNNVAIREHLARVLLVQAIAQPDNAEGRTRKAEYLTEANTILVGISVEGRTAYVVRTTAKWVAEEVVKSKK